VRARTSPASSCCLRRRSVPSSSASSTMPVLCASRAVARGSTCTHLHIQTPSHVATSKHANHVCARDVDCSGPITGSVSWTRPTPSFAHSRTLTAKTDSLRCSRSPSAPENRGSDRERPSSSIIRPASRFRRAKWATHASESPRAQGGANEWVRVPRAVGLGLQVPVLAYDDRFHGGGWR
jgi:hypothetical protein